MRRRRLLTTLLEREWYGEPDETRVSATFYILSPQGETETQRTMLHFNDILSDIVLNEEYIGFSHMHYGRETNVVIPTDSFLYLTYYAQDINGQVIS